MLELVAAGRTPAQLTGEFGCSAQTIANWAAFSGVKTGAQRLTAASPQSSAGREELARLRRENRRLQMERDILAKATAWFAAKSDKTFTPSTDS